MLRDSKPDTKNHIILKIYKVSKGLKKPPAPSFFLDAADRTVLGEIVDSGVHDRLWETEFFRHYSDGDWNIDGLDFSAHRNTIRQTHIISDDTHRILRTNIRTRETDFYGNTIMVTENEILEHHLTTVKRRVRILKQLPIRKTIRRSWLTEDKIKN
jgi:hypothetical protein